MAISLSWLNRAGLVRYVWRLSMSNLTAHFVQQLNSFCGCRKLMMDQLLAPLRMKTLELFTKFCLTFVALCQQSCLVRLLQAPQNQKTLRQLLPMTPPLPCQPLTAPPLIQVSLAGLLIILPQIVASHYTQGLITCHYLLVLHAHWCMAIVVFWIT